MSVIGTQVSACVGVCVWTGTEQRKKNWRLALTLSLKYLNFVLWDFYKKEEESVPPQRYAFSTFLCRGCGGRRRSGWVCRILRSCFLLLAFLPFFPVLCFALLLFLFFAFLISVDVDYLLSPYVKHSLFCTPAFVHKYTCTSFTR